MNMILPIVKIGNAVLRKKCGLVSLDWIQDPRSKDFLQQMIQTMHAAEGVGLAANQVARSVQAIVLECKISNSRYPDRESVPLQIYLNPKIVHYSKEKEEDWEGCLSIPGYRGKVPRSSEVTFEALTPSGELITKTVTGFHARIIQHEVDHINGLFYVDQMKDLSTWGHLDELK
jgi:peptide deformylase